ncbi:MAG: SGNH/GDSL hydrolase family protein [Planctomycetaceae bacterium]
MLRPRFLSRQLLAITVGLAIGLVLAEAGLQVGNVRPQRFSAPRWSAFNGSSFRPSDMWGDGLIKRPSRLAEIDMGEYTPGARFRVEYASNPRGYFDDRDGVEMRVNGVGLRGPEIASQKPEGTLRLLGLGDSFTFGVGVRDDDTFLRRLETRLSARTSCQVLNAGTQGYNTHDQQLVLEDRWLGFKPDIVLVVFYLNDVYRDEAAVAFWNNGEGDGVYLRPTGAARFSLLADWCQHSWRARALQQRMIRHYDQAYFTDPKQFFANPQAPDARKMDWPSSRHALERIAELGRDHGFRVGLAIFPELMSLDDDYPFAAIHELVAAACHKIGLPVHDLFPALKGHAARDLWVHPTDHHPNELAHDLVARSLEQFVRDSLLSAAPGRKTSDNR